MTETGTTPSRGILLDSMLMLALEMNRMVLTKSSGDIMRWKDITVAIGEVKRARTLAQLQQHQTTQDATQDELTCLYILNGTIVHPSKEEIFESHCQLHSYRAFGWEARRLDLTTAGQKEHFPFRTIPLQDGKCRFEIIPLSGGLPYMSKYRQRG